LDGTAAMIPTVSTLTDELTKVSAGRDTNNIGMFILPIQGADGDNHIARMNVPFGLMVPNGGKNVDVALAAVNALCSPTAQQAMYDTTPGLPFILGGVNGNVTGGVLMDAASIIQSGKVSVGFVEPPYDGGVAPATFIQDMLAGNITPVDVLKNLDQNIAKAAQNAGDPNW